MESEGTLTAKSDCSDTETEDETGNTVGPNAKVIVLSNYVIHPANNAAVIEPKPVRFKKAVKKSKPVPKKKVAKSDVSKKNRVNKVESRKPDKTPKDDFAKTSTLAPVNLKTKFEIETSDAPHVAAMDILNCEDGTGTFMRENDSIQRESTFANEMFLERYEVLPSSTKEFHRSMESEQSADRSVDQQTVNTADKTVTIEGNTTGNIFNVEAAIAQSSDQRAMSLVSGAHAVLKEELDIIKQQNAQILSKLSKEFDKKRIYVDSDIKRMIPCGTVDAYQSWDAQVSTDEELYKATRRYLHKFKGEAKNSNYFGSVLIKIVKDEVLASYNYEGVKGNCKFKDTAAVELISDIYKPTDRIQFDKRMRDTINFAKSRYNSAKFQERKKNPNLNED